MKRYLESSQGAALVLELIVLTLVLLASGYAYYQYNTNTHKVAQAKTPKPHLATKTSPTPSPAKPANEFDVPQLGFKMTLPSGLTGLTYTVTSIPDANGTKETATDAYFTTQYLQSAGCQMGVGIGAIGNTPYNPSTINNGGPLDDMSAVKQIGNFYLNFAGSQAECGSNQAVNANQTQMQTLLEQAFSTATAL